MKGREAMVDTKENPVRCWCCGTKLVDESRLKNKRMSPFAARIYHPTGVMVCPHNCPRTREEYETLKAEYERSKSESWYA
jgi:hypothetical protein